MKDPTMKDDVPGRAVHPAAQDGFSSAAETYGRGRPDYPPQLQSWLQRTLGVAPGTRALDLGAGTGKFTPLLLAAGAEVIAVEPVAAMRAQLEAKLPQVRALAASAQSMPLDDASVDAVLCAQAFHWFASAEALREIGRVLRPGGRLGLVWNVRDESVPWVAAITRILTPYEGDTPRYRQGHWRRLFPSELFSELDETVLSYRHVGSAQQVIVDRCLSVSFIAALPLAQREQVATALATLIGTEPALQGDGPVAFPYFTHAYCSTRAPAR